MLVSSQALESCWPEILLLIPSMGACQANFLDAPACLVKSKTTSEWEFWSQGPVSFL